MGPPLSSLSERPLPSGGPGRLPATTARLEPFFAFGTTSFAVWYPIRAVERDRHRRQWHMRQWKSQAVAEAQASKTAADEVGADARVVAHLLPPNIRCARSTGPATPGSEAACTSTTPRERRGGMSKTHSGATRQGTTCSRATAAEGETQPAVSTSGLSLLPLPSVA